MEGVLAEGSGGEIYGGVTASDSSAAAGRGSEGRRADWRATLNFACLGLQVLLEVAAP